MSETWIKMRTNLMTHPKVVAISVTLGAHCSAVCGACYALWCIGDAHSVNGKLPGYTYAVIDAQVGLDGFCKAAEAVEWVRQDADGVTLPRFGSHNGATGKARAQAARRAMRQRSKSDHASVTPASRSRHAASVTKSAPRVDKRREEYTAAAVPAQAVPAASKPAAGAAGAAVVLSAEEIAGRAAYLKARPAWLGESKRWLSPGAIREFAANPRLTQEIVEEAYAEGKAARTLDNPAGLVIKYIRAAIAGGAK